MDEDTSSASAPLMRPDSIEPETPELREQDLTSPTLFIWALTFSAGISGLLFGYEYIPPPPCAPPRRTPHPRAGSRHRKPQTNR